MNGLMKNKNSLDLDEIALLSGISLIFWKKKIYYVLGTTDLMGDFDGNVFYLESNSDKDVFVHQLVENLEWQNVGSRQIEPNENLFIDRQCCKLNGRLGDTYCNLCGRAIPKEYIIEHN